VNQQRACAVGGAVAEAFINRGLYLPVRIDIMVDGRIFTLLNFLLLSNRNVITMHY